MWNILITSLDKSDTYEYLFVYLFVCLNDLTSVSANMAIDLYRQKLQRKFTNSRKLRRANENTMHKVNRHNDVPQIQKYTQVKVMRKNKYSTHT